MARFCVRTRNRFQTYYVWYGMLYTASVRRDNRETKIFWSIKESDFARLVSFPSSSRWERISIYIYIYLKACILDMVCYAMVSMVCSHNHSPHKTCLCVFMSLLCVSILSRGNEGYECFWVFLCVSCGVSMSSRKSSSVSRGDFRCYHRALREHHWHGSFRPITLRELFTLANVISLEK